MEFETFIAMLAIFGFHDKFPSRITPKNIDSLTRSIVYWLITKVIEGKMLPVVFSTVSVHHKLAFDSYWSYV